MASGNSTNEIEIWGGDPRQGIFELHPFSFNAKENQTKPLYAYLTKFPEIKYQTDWGNWDESNSSFITNKIKTFAGAGDSIPARIVQMLAGPTYEPPITTGPWTQLTSQMSDESYLTMDAELVAYPVLSNGYHIEGLRYDKENLSQILHTGGFSGNQMSSIWDWLKLGKFCMMPKAFSAGVIPENIKKIKNNISSETKNGKAVLWGLHEMAHVVDFIWDENVTVENAMRNAMHGLEAFLRGTTGTHQRYGDTFSVLIRDCDTKKFFNSNAGSPLCDFYVTKLDFKFSPHLVKIVNDEGKRKGVAPEYALINLSLKSVCKVSRVQYMNMISGKWEGKGGSF